MSSLYERKWEEFSKRVRLFRFVPFTDFVMASGSLATGKIKEDSDFDVLVGVRYGRIFTNRFFAHLIFGLFGYRRPGHGHDGDVKDKICLNHFVTPASYKEDPPYSQYVKDLYQNLVPVIGDEDLIRYFFEANDDWMEPKRIYKKDERFLGEGRSWFKSFLEFLLGGYLGDILEKRLKSWQKTRAEGGLPDIMPEGARFVCTDEELEFHIDAKMVYSKWESRQNS